MNCCELWHTHIVRISIHFHTWYGRFLWCVWYLVPWKYDWRQHASVATKTNTKWSEWRNGMGVGIIIVSSVCLFWCCCSSRSKNSNPLVEPNSTWISSDHVRFDWTADSWRPKFQWQRSSNGVPHDRAHERQRTNAIDVNWQLCLRVRNVTFADIYAKMNIFSVWCLFLEWWIRIRWYRTTMNLQLLTHTELWCANELKILSIAIDYQFFFLPKYASDSFQFERNGMKCKYRNFSQRNAWQKRKIEKNNSMELDDVHHQCAIDYKLPTPLGGNPQLITVFHCDEAVRRNCFFGIFCRVDCKYLTIIGSTIHKWQQLRDFQFFFPHVKFNVKGYQSQAKEAMLHPSIMKALIFTISSGLTDPVNIAVKCNQLIAGQLHLQFESDTPCMSENR